MLKSIYINRLGILLMASSAVFVATGQLFWKLGTELGQLFFATGFLFYGLGAILLIIAFRFGEVSVLHPFLSLNYVFALYLGYAFLEEEISWNRALGVLIIILGVVLIGSVPRE